MSSQSTHPAPQTSVLSKRNPSSFGVKCGRILSEHFSKGLFLDGDQRCPSRALMLPINLVTPPVLVSVGYTALIL